MVVVGAAAPAGIAYDPATGYLYVCDPGNNRIAVFRS
jgi:DNA-binding beta-propeller fold protein YncE